MPNLELIHKKDITPFRRLSIGTWRTAYDPSVYGTMQIRMDRATAYIEAFRQKTGVHVTVSHLVARAAAEALKKNPDSNAVLRFNRVYLRKRIGVFFQVVLRDEETGKLDLSGATISDVEQKSLSQMVAEMGEKVKAVRKGTDKELEKSRRSFDSIPMILMNYVIRFVSFLGYTLNLDLKAFGMPKDMFGSIMITNIGVLGLEAAYAPLVPYSRVPILLALGNVKKVPAVVEDKIKIVQVMDINATFDHRIMEGSQAALMASVIRAWMEDPEGNFGPIPEG